MHTTVDSTAGEPKPAARPAKAIALFRGTGTDVGLRAVGLALLGFLAAQGCAYAQAQGISAKGATGGLVIPSAHVLERGSVAFTAGGYQEPELGDFTRRRNFSLGVGFFDNLEVFGRFAEYQNPLPGQRVANGPRDISANIKYRLPTFFRSAPAIALGATDIGGGAPYFRSVYAVASDRWGPLGWTVGFAKGRPASSLPGSGQFDGLFGGLELFAGDTGLSALAEYDGRQKHVGLRYQSPAIAPLANARIVGTLQRSLSGTDALGREANRTTAALSLVVPFGENVPRTADFRPQRPLPALDASAPQGTAATPADRLEALHRGLVAAGLERVRVGTLARDLVIEFENHRFDQDEADAIGIVLGLGVEFAPPGAQRVYAVVHKAGLRLYECSTAISEYRSFLRSADAHYPSSSLAVDIRPTYDVSQVQWIRAEPSPRTRVRVELAPDLIYTVATDVGAFDYSLAANLQAIVPLWTGAELYTSYIQRVADSENFDTDGIFVSSRHRNGLRTAAVHQSFWLGRHVLGNIGVGRYHYDRPGVQAESTVFIPGSDDVLRLKAGAYERLPGTSRSDAIQFSASYRWVYSGTTWVEGGWQKYSDGSYGPSIGLTRWFGDVSANVFFRRGGNKQFAGLELSFPLTPRRGMEPGAVTFAGTPRYAQAVRTRIAGGSTAVNAVEAGAVRDFRLDYNQEMRQLNSGRMSQRYFIARLQRMREAFYLYARDLVGP